MHVTARGLYVHTCWPMSSAWSWSMYMRVTCSRRRDCHSADALSQSLLVHLLKVEGVQQNDSLVNG